MSTKIHDGKRLPNMTAYELNNFYQRIRMALLPVAIKEYQQLIARIAQSVYVYLTTGIDLCEYDLDLNDIKEKGITLNAMAIAKYAKHHANRLVKKTSKAILWEDAEMSADFDVSICFLPLADKTLCIPSANNAALMHELTAFPEFIDYGYWNNTDPPKNISEQEWSQRKTDWHNALPGIGVPRENGFVVKVIDAVMDIVYNVDCCANIYHNIQKHLDNDDDLASRVAYRSLVDKKFNELLPKYEDANSGMSTYRIFCTAMHHVDKQKDVLAAETEKYRSIVNSHQFFASLLE
jgi:hypothetical protein